VALSFLLDTNVVIGVLGGAEISRQLIEDRGTALENCAVSQITRMELLSFPLLTDDDETQIHRFLSALPVLPIDERVEGTAIALRRQTRLKLPDAIILATARVHGLELLTLDDRLRAAASL